MLRRYIQASAVALGCILSGALVFAQVGDTEGIKATERFVKAGDEALAAIYQARAQVEATLNAYVTLTETPGGNLKNEYKKVLKATDEANKKLAAVTPRMDAMKQQAEAYFALREATIAKIADPGLRKTADDRLAASKADFNRVTVAVSDAGGALAPFMKDLGDHIQFLGADLQKSALAALKPDALKLKGQAATLFGKTDDAVKTAKAYFGEMRTK